MAGWLVNADGDRGSARKAWISETDAAALEAFGRRQGLFRRSMVLGVMMPGVRSVCM